MYVCVAPTLGLGLTMVSIGLVLQKVCCDVTSG